jgi:CRP-like cAMP-binding protein
MSSMSTQPPGRNAFLAGLDGEDFSLLRTHLSPRELRVGDNLHRGGERIDEILFPHSGLVTMTAPTGGETGAGIALIGRDGFVGGFAAAASAPATCDAEVLIAGHASRMSASAFRYALDRSAGLRHWAAQFDNALMAQTQQTALCNAAHSVEARICRHLLEVLDRSGGERIPLTQGTLARLLGVRRTTVTLVAGRLEALGLLNCRRGFMQIVDRSGLEQCCCECYGHMRKHGMRLVPQRNDRISVVGQVAPGPLAGPQST